MKALVIGAGRMGTFHKRALQDLGCDVTTVDPRPDARADYTAVPHTRYSIVCIAVPIPYLAQEAAMWAGHAGHLLIEKPMATNTHDARELTNLLAQTDTKVAVGYVERFTPPVRKLKDTLADHPPPTIGRFTRWNDRPSHDVTLDLRAHDIDLANHLDVAAPMYDTRAGQPIKRRDVQVETNARTFKANLMDHTTSPLHAQWHAFLAGHGGYATPTDALHVLTALGRHGKDTTTGLKEAA